MITAALKLPKDEKCLAWRQNIRLEIKKLHDQLSCSYFTPISYCTSAFFNQMDVSKELHIKGAFNNHVDKKRGEGVRQMSTLGREGVMVMSTWTKF